MSSHAGSFSEATPLFDVLQDPQGRALVDAYLPGLTSSAILHTLYGYPVGLVVKTDPQLQDRPSMDAFTAALHELVPGPVSASAAAGPGGDDAPQDDAENRGVDPDDDEPRVPDVPAGARVHERVEIGLRGPRGGNPYTDVVLGAVVDGPGGTVEVPGFYRGDGRYAVRFLPWSEGRYTFRTSSEVSALDGVTGEVQVDGPATGAHGPVRVAERYHFAHADGTRFQPVGTTAYAWLHQPQALQDATVASLADAPFTKLRMCLFPKFYLFNENEPEILPYVRRADGTPDLSRFDERFWAGLERRLDQLAGLGIEADLILFHAYDRWGFATMSVTQDDRYVRYAVARLSSFANVWWSLANEYDLLFEKTERDWERIAETVRRNDPVHHLTSIHNCHQFYDHSRPWVTHASLQRQDVYKTAEMISQWREEWGKPVILDELGYEGDIDQGWGNLTGPEVVRRFWEGAVRGGYLSHGETFLDDDDELWWSKGGVLRGESPARLGFLREIVEQAPGGRLEPLPLDWDVPRAGVDHEYYLYYFGANQPRFRRFLFDPAYRWTVDVLDTWAMTVTPLPGEYSGRFVIDLPGRPFIAVRLRAL